MLRRDGGGPRPDGRRVMGLVMVGAVAVAPLLGLLYGREVGFAVLVAALAVTIGTAVRAVGAAPVEARGRLRALILLNAAILAVAVGVIMVAVT